MKAFSNIKNHGQNSLRFAWAFAVLAGIAVLGISIVIDSNQRRSEDQLSSDVRALNAALEIHRIFKGTLNADNTVEGVLAQLQDFDENGTLVDNRLRAEDQDHEEASSSAPRAVWNRLTQRFEIAHGAVSGVKRFYIDENPDPDRLAEEQRIAKIDLEAGGTWMWNYEEEVKPIVRPLYSNSAKMAPKTGR